MTVPLISEQRTIRHCSIEGNLRNKVVTHRHSSSFNKTILAFLILFDSGNERFSQCVIAYFNDRLHKIKYTINLLLVHLISILNIDPLTDRSLSRLLFFSLLIRNYQNCFMALFLLCSAVIITHKI